ncbi:MAG: XRE family transcriptional regulator [Leucobacter sp.]
MNHMDDDVFLTPDLARAARAFTKVSTTVIGQAAGLSKDEVRRFERSTGELSPAQKSRLREALEEYGALFIPEDDTGGYGVRRRHTREKLMRLDTWEGEGGPA